MRRRLLVILHPSTEAYRVTLDVKPAGTARTCAGTPPAIQVQDTRTVVSGPCACFAVLECGPA